MPYPRPVSALKTIGGHGQHCFSVVYSYVPVPKKWSKKKIEKNCQVREKIFRRKNFGAPRKKSEKMSKFFSTLFFPCAFAPASAKKASLFHFLLSCLAPSTPLWGARATLLLCSNVTSTSGDMCSAQPLLQTSASLMSSVPHHTNARLITSRAWVWT